MAKKSIVMGAAILMFANIITRILGFAYRIYMSNLIGAEGMGLYQLIMPIYMLCWSISSSGFTTTVSKLAAQEHAKKSYGNMSRVLKQSVFITSSIGLLLGIILFFFSDIVAVYIIKDPRVYNPLKILSFCFPFMAAGSCIRGWFNGLRENTVPAISQVFEQMIRMAAIYLLSGTFIKRGVESACTAAVIGIVAGEILSFLLVSVWYVSFKRGKGYTKKPSWGTMETLTVILAGAVPLTANRITSSLLMTIENILIPQKLQLFGSGSSEALRQYGMLTGMASPLISFPSAILTAISITLVPAVSEAVTLGNKNRIGYTVAKSMLFTTTVGIGASSLFLIFPKEIGLAIFGLPELSSILFKLAFLCPFLYIQITMSGLLNGLSEQLFIFKINLLSSVINIFSVVFFVPRYGLDAFILSWFISVLISCYLCISKTCGRTELVFDIKNWLYKPVISALAAGLVARYIADAFLFERLSYVMATVLGIVVLTGLYSFFVFSLDAVSRDDIMAVTRGIRL